MAEIRLTITTAWRDRFDAYARDAIPWGDRPGETGPDPRTTTQLYKLLELRDTKGKILNFEKNLRAEFGGDLPPDLDDVT